jgi:hypothetical protein
MCAKIKERMKEEIWNLRFVFGRYGMFDVCGLVFVFCRCWCNHQSSKAGGDWCFDLCGLVFVVWKVDFPADVGVITNHQRQAGIGVWMFVV